MLAILLTLAPLSILVGSFLRVLDATCLVLTFYDGLGGMKEHWGTRRKSGRRSGDDGTRVRKGDKIPNVREIVQNGGWRVRILQQNSLNIVEPNFLKFFLGMHDLHWVWPGSRKQNSILREEGRWQMFRFESGRSLTFSPWGSNRVDACRCRGWGNKLLFSWW